MRYLALLLLVSFSASAETVYHRKVVKIADGDTLTLLVAHAIVFCTRMPAGEVDRGTIDVLLSLPVSRTRVYLCESVVWLASGVLVVAFGVLGHVVGGRYTGPDTVRTASELVIINVNLYCLYAAVGGMACLVSALSDRRGRAIGIVFGIVLASFLLNFLAPFSDRVAKVSFMSVLNYYKPVFILRDAAWPVSDVLVLSAAAGAFWLAGAVILARRDICTV